MTGVEKVVCDVTLKAGLPVEELHRRLESLNRATDLGHRALAFYLHDMQERRVFQATGHSSAVHYATARLGMSRRRARELLEAGRALAGLPKVDEVFAAGQLSWTKVRLLTEVVVSKTQEAWLKRARQVSCRELEHEVRGVERGSPPGRDRLAVPQVRFHVGALLDPLQHEKWEEAKRSLAIELGRTVTDEDLMLYAAEVALGNGRRPTGKPAPGKGASSYRVIVHRCPECERSAVQTGDGPEPLDRSTAGMVACDGQRVDPQRPPDQVDQPTPSWLREAVLARDGCRCRSCGLRWNLMVHHLVYRARGGPSRAENLITLCGRCHALVHSDLLRIEGAPEGVMRFLDRAGEPVRSDGFAHGVAGLG